MQRMRRLFLTRLVISKPFTFGLRCILYPLVIGYRIVRWLKTGGREIYAEAKIRQMSKNPLHLAHQRDKSYSIDEVRRRYRCEHLSIEEFIQVALPCPTLVSQLAPVAVEKIKKFAKSNLSLAHWKRQLGDLGLKPQHSFAAALLVTLVFVLVIRPAETGAKSVKALALTSIALEQTETCNNLARMCVDDSRPEKRMPSDWPIFITLCCPEIERLNFRTAFVIEGRERPPDEFWRKIDHIPIQLFSSR